MRWKEARLVCDSLEVILGAELEEHSCGVCGVVLARLVARTVFAMKPQHREAALNAFVALTKGELRQLAIAETMKEVGL